MKIAHLALRIKDRTDISDWAQNEKRSSRGEGRKTARRHVGVGAETHDTEPALRYGLMYGCDKGRLLDENVANSWRMKPS